MSKASQDKCNAVRAKIEESNCSIFCIQETKTHHFDPSLIRKLTPKRFNKFAFIPSEGASGGILVGWNDLVFSGNALFTSRFSITIHFTSMHNSEQWKLTTSYGPCQGQEGQEFVDWFNDIQIADQEN
jgi:hypothetical protein